MLATTILRPNLARFNDIPVLKQIVLPPASFLLPNSAQTDVNASASLSLGNRNDAELFQAILLGQSPSIAPAKFLLSGATPIFADGQAGKQSQKQLLTSQIFEEFSSTEKPAEPDVAFADPLVHFGLEIPVRNWNHLSNVEALVEEFGLLRNDVSTRDCSDCNPENAPKRLPSAGNAIAVVNKRSTDPAIQTNLETFPNRYSAMDAPGSNDSSTTSRINPSTAGLEIESKPVVQPGAILSQDRPVAPTPDRPAASTHSPLVVRTKYSVSNSTTTGNQKIAIVSDTPRGHISPTKQTSSPLISPVGKAKLNPFAEPAPTSSISTKPAALTAATGTVANSDLTPFKSSVGAGEKTPIAYNKMGRPETGKTDSLQSTSATEVPVGSAKPRFKPTNHAKPLSDSVRLRVEENSQSTVPENDSRSPIFSQPNSENKSRIGSENATADDVAVTIFEKPVLASELGRPRLPVQVSPDGLSRVETNALANSLNQPELRQHVELDAVSNQLKWDTGKLDRLNQESGTPNERYAPNRIAPFPFRDRGAESNLVATNLEPVGPKNPVNPEPIGVLHFPQQKNGQPDQELSVVDIPYETHDIRVRTAPTTSLPVPGSTAIPVAISELMTPFHFRPTYQPGRKTEAGARPLSAVRPELPGSNAIELKSTPTAVGSTPNLSESGPAEIAALPNATESIATKTKVPSTATKPSPIQEPFSPDITIPAPAFSIQHQPAPVHPVVRQDTRERHESNGPDWVPSVHQVSSADAAPPMPAIPSHQTSETFQTTTVMPNTAHTPTSVATQISSQLTGVENGWVTVSLDPADLGPMQIHVSHKGDEIAVEILVKDPATLRWLEQNRDHLIDALGHEGVRLDDLTLRQGADHDPSGRQEHLRSQQEHREQLRKNRLDKVPETETSPASRNSYTSGNPHSINIVV